MIPASSAECNLPVLPVSPVRLRRDTRASLSVVKRWRGSLRPLESTLNLELTSTYEDRVRNGRCLLDEVIHLRNSSYEVCTPYSVTNRTVRDCLMPVSATQLTLSWRHIAATNWPFPWNPLRRSDSHHGGHSHSTWRARHRRALSASRTGSSPSSRTLYESVNPDISLDGSILSEHCHESGVTPITAAQWLQRILR